MLRIAAIIAVVIIHSIAIGVFNQPLGSADWWLGNIVNGFTRWSVPVFVMISGALLIKESAFTDMATFYKKRASRTLIPLAVWPSLYALWSLYVMRGSVSWSGFFYGYLSGNPAVAFHLYFLFLIIGLYVLTPFISMYVFTVSRRQLWLTTLILLAASFMWLTIESVLPGRTPSYNMLTQGLPYVGYFVLGYLLKDFSPKKRWLPLVAFVSGSLIMAALTWYAWPASKTYFVDYLSATVMVTSSFAFILGRQTYWFIFNRLQKRRKITFNRIVRHVAAASFGIYLVHLMVLQTILHKYKLDWNTVTVGLSLVPIVLIISWVITSMLLRIPKLRLILG